MLQLNDYWGIRGSSRLIPSVLLMPLMLPPSNAVRTAEVSDFGGEIEVD